MHRYAAFLLSFLAGFLFLNPVQAQTLVDADGPPPQDAPTGTHNVNADTATASSILYAHNGGTITGQTGNLTLNVTGNGTQEVRALNAVGTSSLIEMTAGETVINMLINPTSAHYRGAIADSGGTVTLTHGTISLGPGPPWSESEPRSGGDRARFEAERNRYEDLDGGR